MTTAYLFVPDGFDPFLSLPSALCSHADVARYFLHNIVIKVVARRADEDGFVPLNAATLRPYFPNNYIYKNIRDALIDNGSILSDNRYIKDEKSIGYKLGPGLNEMPHRRIAVTNPLLARKLKDRRERMLTGVQPDVHGYHRRERMMTGVQPEVRGYLQRCLFEIEIDYEAALDTLLRGDHEPSDETAIQMIQDKEFFLHVCEFGRVHTNLTNLKSAMRRFLTLRGQPLVNLDIRNSQPLFFGVLLRERYRSASMPDDVRRYLELVQAGRFYDHLMDASQIPAAERARFKREFFGRVFFCKNDPVHEAARLFGAEFPNVYRVIREMKEADYRALAHALQRAESSLMIGGVAARMMREMPDAWIATVHDSVVTTTNQADSVLAIMKEEFAKVGLNPTINQEPLAP
jgi:hypothetical protein